jgi:DNA anti-recombination protein RmuC
MTENHHRNGSATAHDPAADLARVRDILFGAEQRRTNDEIATLRSEAESMRLDFEKRLEAVRADAERERQQLRHELEQQLERMKDGKLDREALAEMFGNMVSRLVPASADKADG